MLPPPTRLTLARLTLIVALVATTYVARRQTALLTAAPLPIPTSNVLAPTAAPAPTAAAQVAVPAFTGAVMNDRRFSYEPDWYAPEVQAFLEGQPGPLKNFRDLIGDREHSFAEFLISQTTLYSLNPKVVLALIETQSGLVSNNAPSPDAVDWLLGYQGDDGSFRGVLRQSRWALRELRRAVREYGAPPPLVYADGTQSPVPPGLSLAEYSLTRVLAATTTTDALPAKLAAFRTVYSRWWGDAAAPPTGWPEPAAPFLERPTAQPFAISSFFDHDLPFLRENGSLVSYRGDRSQRISYDGHTGWDYAMRPPDPILAAAAGTVVFAGNSDDGCGVARVVIVDHGNGYRTLYWHLSEISVGPGPVQAGAVVGIVGASGCATGPHLHFQVQFLGRDVDPYGWCGAADTDPWAAYPGGQTSVWLWRWMVSPCGAAPGTAVDTGDTGFRRQGMGWNELAGGWGGTGLQATTVVSPGDEVAVGMWQPALPAAGSYRLLAWIPYIDNGLLDAAIITYTVDTADGPRTVPLSQAASANTWADLGTYPFDPATARVTLSALSPDAEHNAWFDVIAWVNQ